MAPAGYPTAPLGATAETTRQGHGSATPPKNPETRQKQIKDDTHHQTGEGGTRKEYEKP